MQIEYLRISQFELNDLNCLRFIFQTNNCTTVAKNSTKWTYVPFHMKSDGNWE